MPTMNGLLRLDPKTSLATAMKRMMLGVVYTVGSICLTYESKHDQAMSKALPMFGLDEATASSKDHGCEI